MMRRLSSQFLVFALFLSFFSFGFSTAANAVSLGSGNCVSFYTETSGTFTATAIQVGSNCVVVFKTVENNSSSATGNWTLPVGTFAVQYLVVGGGGSSSRGTCGVFWGSGGGGGEVVAGTSSLTGTVAITVGNGGVNKSGNCGTSSPPPRGSDGVNSTFSSVTARGGKGGSATAIGGSSGNTNSGGTGNGTAGCGAPNFCNAGGGGGAGSAGSGINAGNGVASNLSGASVIYGAGGAGRGDSVFGTSESTCAGTSTRFDAVMHTGCGGSDAGSTMGSGGSGIIVAVYAFDTTAPTFTNSTTFSIAENTATSTNAATITVNESSTITITSGTDSARFTLGTSDSVTARIRFAAIPNFEAPLDVGTNNVYDISVRATDTAGNIANQSISITVTNVNEAPTITINSSNETHTITQAENISSVVTYTATDVDAATTLSWSLSGTDAADFSINSSSGVLAFSSNPDFEAPADSDTNNSYVIIVTVSDGALTDTQTVTITITNANENASINAPTVSGTINKGVATTITVTINVAGKVRFFVGGKRISTCKDRTTSGTYPNNSATCSWRPAVTGRQILTATLTPTDNTFSASTSAPTTVQVVRRGTTR